MKNTNSFNSRRKHGKFFPLAAIALATILLTPDAPFAAGPAGGFQGPGPESVTVRQALGMKDDAKFCLEGRIVKNLGGERYEFTDGTASIKVEIDDDEWGGVTVGPQDTVVICGELDKDFTDVEFDVESLTRP